MKLLTSSEAAKELGVSTRTLERYREQGIFLPIQRTLGGHSRYTDEQVENAKKGVFSISDDMKELMS